MKRHLLPLCASVVALAACDDTMYTNPAPLLSPPDDAGMTVVDAQAEAPAPAPDAFVPEAGPVRRTIMNRSPFGNLAYTDNLLLDGDMEMSNGGQSPWIAIGAVSQVSLTIETGGRCRSGLRCLVLDNVADILFGYGVAAKDKPLEFWMSAKVPGQDCSVVTVYLFPQMTWTMTMFHQVMAESPTPDDTGWCRFHTVRSAMDEAVGVWVEAKLLANQHVIVDDAVLRPADGLSPTSQRSIDSAMHARIVSKLGPILRKRRLE